MMDREQVFQSIPDETFANLKHYLMFVGSARSGHSVFGAILDAHPNIVVSNELHALTLFEELNFDRIKVFKLILADALARDQSRQWNNTGYDYNLPGLAQGRYERLEVLGDKKAGQSSMFTLRQPDVLDRMLKLLGPMLKVVLVLRNPFDTISAMAHHQKREISPAMIERYFRRLDGALAWQSALPKDQLIAVRHEELIADKHATIAKLCGFVNQQASTEYVNQCAAMVYSSPNKRRRTVTWSENDKRLVQQHIHSDRYRAALEGYDFSTA